MISGIQESRVHEDLQPVTGWVLDGVGPVMGWVLDGAGAGRLHVAIPLVANSKASLSL